MMLQNWLTPQRRGRAGLLLALCLLASLGVTGTQPVRAAPHAITWPDLRLTKIAEGFVFPVHLAAADDGSERLFVVEKGGKIHILLNGQRLPDPFLDITDRVNSSCGECGLLSVAFPPDYADEGYFFVFYNAKENLFPSDPLPPSSQDSVIARFRVSADPNRADPDSEEHILTQKQPETNHNGGQLAFAPDGTLYIGFGDGGGAGDPFGSGQRLSTWLGKILRIRVGPTGPYTVPDDNPFVGQQNVRPEIWAYGLRNPWRFAFGPDGALYIGDVGQSTYEEINYEPPGHLGGSNYGWVIMEGPACYPPPNATCNPTGLTLPIAHYGRGLDCSVTGGMVFTSRAAGQAPVYLYGDWCSGRIRGLQWMADEMRWEEALLLQTGLRISSFGADAAGNLYVVDGGGEIYLLEEAGPILSFRHWLPTLSR